jgi:4-hydroxyphenylpyruvate dioxygenase
LNTDDIFETVRRFQANGVELLAIPENYYDDLEARSDLTSGQISRFRAARILYDTEGASEYFQVYTQTMEGGFFFEVVQRKGYRGFGAVNAPIRLAAQAQLSSSFETSPVEDRW